MMNIVYNDKKPSMYLSRVMLGSELCFCLCSYQLKEALSEFQICDQHSLEIVVTLPLQMYTVNLHYQIGLWQTVIVSTELLYSSW